MSAQEDLLQLAQRVSIVNSTTALLDGRELRPETRLPLTDETGSTEHEQEPVGNRGALPPMSWLAMQLYGHCYIRPVARSRMVSDAGAVREFRRALSLANVGRGTWESGWRFEGRLERRGGASASYRVSRYGVLFSAPADRVRGIDPTPPRGRPVRFWCRRSAATCTPDTTSCWATLPGRRTTRVDRTSCAFTGTSVAAVRHRCLRPSRVS